MPPTRSKGEYVVCLRLVDSSTKPNLLVLTGEAIRCYFYLLGREHAPISLYKILELSDAAKAGDLRTAFRIKRVAAREDVATRVPLERAFNILGNFELRQCYDSLCRDENTPPLFPYGGTGQILVEGNLSAERGIFFADHILAYKPNLTLKRTSLLLRKCEFFADHIVCGDVRRKIEVWLDTDLLPALTWDLTWNR